jgi:hypothetical protein
LDADAGVVLSLMIAVPCALASAVAYGASTAVQHAAAHGTHEDGSGGLTALVRNPRWLLGMGGDGVGLALQVAALATGPVVLIQPILVLALPVSLPIAWALGGPKPGPPQYRACAWLLGGLGLFFVLLGTPGSAQPTNTRATLIASGVVVGLGLLALLGGRGANNSVRAALYGGVAGAWFGFVAVLMDAASTAGQAHGAQAFTHAQGLVPLIILLALGGVSITLTQIAFQVGALAASFPANLAADPVVAVVLGEVLLHEDLPLSPVRIVAYVLCLAGVVFGAVRLAASP